MTTKNEIEAFLQAETFGVVGASNDRHKYGNKVLRGYLQNGMPAVPIHPSESLVEGQKAYARLAEAPAIEAISIITPPPVTESIVDTAIETGVKRIWMQPGAESKTAIERATEAGLQVIAGGPCILVALRFREED